MTRERRSDEADEDRTSVTDPVAAADSAGIGIEQRTRVHENRQQYQEHCESDAVGRAIVGVTDEDDRVLLVVNRDRSVAMLPNDTVTSGENWATVGREWIEETTGMDVSIDGIERVRRINHEIDSENTPVSTTHHVVFSGSVPSKTAIDGLCADNPFELGWYEEFPVVKDESEHISDVQLFIC